MSAHADDLRHFYSETIGDTEVINAVNGGSTPSGQLEPGRYLVHFQNIAGAATVWIRQGVYSAGSPVVAAAAAPSTPVAVAVPPFIPINFYTIVHAARTDQIAAITDAGTADVVITKISRDKR